MPQPKSGQRVGDSQSDEVKVSCGSYLRRRAPPTALAAGIGNSGQGIDNLDKKATLRRMRCSTICSEVFSTHNAHVWELPSCLPLSEWRESPVEEGSLRGLSAQILEI